MYYTSVPRFTAATILHLSTVAERILLTALSVRLFRSNLKIDMATLIMIKILHEDPKILTQVLIFYDH